MLSVQHLSKSYGATTVLGDVTFQVLGGERVGLIGPNGSGKSTLLRCLVGDEAPDSGAIVLTPKSLNIGYLPQLADGLLTPNRPLSGGQKTRLGLERLMRQQPDLLLLDEPTNHLDADALAWLERYLNTRFGGGVLVVSHDRAFLDATVDRILYLDPETHAVRPYAGAYAEFAEARGHERQLQAQAWREQQEYVARVTLDVGRLKSQARSIENSTTAREPGLRKFARKKAAVAKSRERKLERYLDSDERVERPKPRWPIHLDFGTPPPGGRALVRVEDVSFAYPPPPIAAPASDAPTESAPSEREPASGRAPNSPCSHTSIWRSATGSALRSSDPTAAAKPRFCASSAANWSPPPDVSCSAPARVSAPWLRNTKRSIRTVPSSRPCCSSGR